MDWLINGLESHHQKGISNDEESLKRRREVFGNNLKEVKEPPGLIELFCQAMEDVTLRILLVAAILSIVLATSTADA